MIIIISRAKSNEFHRPKKVNRFIYYKRHFSWYFFLVVDVVVDLVIRWETLSRVLSTCLNINLHNEAQKNVLQTIRRYSRVPYTLDSFYSYSAHAYHIARIATDTLYIRAVLWLRWKQLEREGTYRCTAVSLEHSNVSFEFLFCAANRCQIIVR